jgi:hypothetical protein
MVHQPHQFMYVRKTTLHDNPGEAEDQSYISIGSKCPLLLD